MAPCCSRDSVLFPWLRVVDVTQYCFRGSVLLPSFNTVSVARCCCRGSVLVSWLGTVARYWHGGSVGETGASCDNVQLK